MLVDINWMDQNKTNINPMEITQKQMSQNRGKFLHQGVWLVSHEREALRKGEALAVVKAALCSPERLTQKRER